MTSTDRSRPVTVACNHWSPCRTEACFNVIRMVAPLCSIHH